MSVQSLTSFSHLRRNKPVFDTRFPSIFTVFFFSFGFIILYIHDILITIFSINCLESWLHTNHEKKNRTQKQKKKNICIQICACFNQKWKTTTSAMILSRSIIYYNVLESFTEYVMKNSGHLVLENLIVWFTNLRINVFGFFFFSVCQSLNKYCGLFILFSSLFFGFVSIIFFYDVVVIIFVVFRMCFSESITDCHSFSIEIIFETDQFQSHFSLSILHNQFLFFFFLSWQINSGSIN